MSAEPAIDPQRAPEPSTALVEQPPVTNTYPEPLRSAFSNGRQQVERPVRDRPIISRRPLMTLTPAPQPTAIDPALARLALTPAPSRGLTPASAWLTPPAAPPNFAARLPAPRPYVSTPYAAAYADRPEVVPASPSSYAESAVSLPDVPPVEDTPIYDTPAYEASAYEAPPYEAPPPPPTPETIETPSTVPEAMPAATPAADTSTAYVPSDAPLAEAVPSAPIDTPAPAVVDPMAPRADAPIFRIQPRSDAPAPAPVPAPSPEPAAAAASAGVPATPDAAFDPMAPRADAPVFRLQRPAAAGMAQATEAVPEQQGARYYSVHRQNGQRPDATVLPEGVFLDSLPVDLAEPPPPPTVVRDRNGQNRVIVPNEDPSLP